LLLASTTARAEQSDKVEHAAVSSVISSGATLLLKDTEHPVLYAFGLTMLAGFAKEAYDSRSGGTGWSWSDLGADAVGAALGAGVTGLIIGPRFLGWRTTW
ncbi:MAG TPA: hypothetical protein VMT29_12390, partial [Steroidobacteraceae bacterium]|nr:hypothetical protein [Steroidobacteraceae bacterium]